RSQTKVSLRQRGIAHNKALPGDVHLQRAGTPYHLRSIPTADLPRAPRRSSLARSCTRSNTGGQHASHPNCDCYAGKPSRFNRGGFGLSKWLRAMRNQTLLPEMKNGHVRRTKPPASTFGRWNRLVLATVALAAAGIAPFVIQVWLGPAPDDYEAIIRKAGFNPLTSPSRLRGPGAIYEARDGYYQKVCPDSPRAAALIQTSRTLDRNLRRLENNGF